MLVLQAEAFPSHRSITWDKLFEAYLAPWNGVAPVDSAMPIDQVYRKCKKSWSVADPLPDQLADEALKWAVREQSHQGLLDLM